MADLHDLDPDQQVAVGAMLEAGRTRRWWLHVVIAMAGSGKTRSLTALVRELIAAGENPDSIVAISFTNRASDELRRRIHDQVGPPSYGVHSTTFHKFCQSLLPGADARRMIDDTDAKGWFSEWIAEEARRLQVDWGDVFFGGAAEATRLISFFKTQMLVPTDVVDLPVSDLPTDVSRRQALRLRDAWARYETWKDREGLFDPDDLQWRLWLAMRAQPIIVEEARLRFRWLAVDEAQDLSPIQMHLARQLAGPHLVFVGDINQSIYGFRGARRAMLAATAEQEAVDGRQVRVHWLPRNYRANATLVRRGNKILGLQADRRLLRPMRATRDVGPDVHLRWFPDPLAEAEGVARQIKDLVDAGVPGHEIVALTRVNARSMLLASELAALDVPYVRPGKKGFWGLWPIQQALAWLRLASGTLRPEDLGVACKAPRMYWPKVLTSQLALRMSTAPTLSHALRQPFQKRGETRAALHMDQILRDVKRQKSAQAALQKLYDAESSDYQPEARETFYTAGADRRSRADNSRAEALDQLMEIARSASTLAQFLTEADDRARQERMLLQRRDKLRDAHVSVMSIHRVKGLEFDHVFLLGMSADLMPHPRADPDEEARVFYVAETRARQHMHISWSGDHPIESASPFLAVWPDLTAQMEANYYDPQQSPEQEDPSSDCLS